MAKLIIVCGTLSTYLRQEVCKLCERRMEVVSQDSERDVGFQRTLDENPQYWGGNMWDERLVQISCHFKISHYLSKGLDVVYQNSNHPLLLWLWAKKKFGWRTKIEFVNCRTTRSLAIRHLTDMTDEEVLRITPKYFHGHIGEEYRSISVGAKRARAVLLSELRRYPWWRFKLF